MRLGLRSQPAQEGCIERDPLEFIRVWRNQWCAGLQALPVVTIRGGLFQMKIIVCIKKVPAKDSTLRIGEDHAWIRDTDISFEINEPDAYALETALRLKEQHGGEVVA